MKKTILKTALITVLILIGVLFTSVFSIFVFAPKYSAKISYDLGMKNVSTSCYERVYKKTGEMEDLITVIDSAVYAENTDKVIEYGVKLFDVFSDTNVFYDFCKSSDVGLAEDAYSTYDYYSNTVFMALYSSGKKSDAAKFAIKHMNDFNEKSVLKTAYRLADPTNDKMFGTMLVYAYKSMMKEINTSSYATFVKEMKAYKDADGNAVYKI